MTYLSSVKSYNPSNGTWSTTTDLHAPRSAHTATQLLDGRILIAGGGPEGSVTRAELFDPTTENWILTEEMNFGYRGGHQSELLTDGRVLTVGGAASLDDDPSQAEIYDPATNQWILTASMNDARIAFTATQLPDGRVLVVGGDIHQSAIHHYSAELFDPTEETWTTTSSLHNNLTEHSAVSLSNGNVLIVGGTDYYPYHPFYGGLTTRTEIYQPVPASESIIVSTTNDIFDINGRDCNDVIIAELPGEDGLTSLREGICAANNTPTEDIHVIGFHIDSGLQTIVPTAPLPTVIRPVIIDGTIQPGFNGVPLIELDGSDSGSFADGLNISAGSSTIRGLVINRFASTGIYIHTQSGNQIIGNYLGTDPSGVYALGNGAGIAISGSPDNQIGSSVPSSGNLISGNTILGVYVVSEELTNNKIIGNKIGTDISGELAMGNEEVGVYLTAPENVIGGTKTGEGNLISDSLVGIYLNSIKQPGHGEF